MTQKPAPKPFDGKAWIATYMRDLDRRLQREQSEAKFRKLLADLERGRRDEERLGVKVVDLSYQHARLMQAINGSPIPVKVLLDKHRVLAADVVLPSDEANVPRWRAHIGALSSKLLVFPSYVVVAQQNAYAMPAQKRVELPPINNAEGYADALHELGHCARPCAAPHRRVKSSGNSRRTLCVRCELNAWNYAINHAEPHWTRAMHRELAESLSSYRKYGTPAEQAEIDALCSTKTYCDARLARSMKGL